MSPSRRACVAATLAICLTLASCGGAPSPAPRAEFARPARSVTATPTLTLEPTLTPTTLPGPPAIVSPSPTAATTPTPALTEAQVVNVVDGDTITVSIGDRLYTVRYIGIDTPETVHPSKPVQWMGAEASAANAALVEGQTVYLEKDVSETDRYGRLLAYVYLADGRMVNEELVRLGYAYSSSYPPDVYRQGAMIAAQQTAVASGVGLWGTPPPEVAAQTPTPEAADRSITIDLGSAVILSEYGGTQVPEFMAVTNTGDTDVDLTGWYLFSVRHGAENQTFYFPDGYVLAAGATVRVYSGPGGGEAVAAADGVLFWTEDRMWNDKGDPAELYDADGIMVSTLG